MARKRWTPTEEITDSLLRVREKKKWQLAYRRYVIEKAPSESYARYFGLDIASLRQWFELQFTEEIEWDNFGKAWQFEHIVPATYFDYSDEDDRILCWSFINIRIEKLDAEKSGGDKIDPMAVRPYFQELHAKTGFSLCLKMLEKIKTIELSNTECPRSIENFIRNNKSRLEQMASFDQQEFNSLNQGSSVEDVLLEREILRKFGSGQKP
jgi:hypothetical protein